MGILLLLGVIAASARPALPRNLAAWQSRALAAGVGMALWGAKRTRYERRDGQLYYLPHTYTGIAVTPLVFGRLVYRFAQSTRCTPSRAGCRRGLRAGLCTAIDGAKPRHGGIALRTDRLLRLLLQLSTVEIEAPSRRGPRGVLGPLPFLERELHAPGRSTAHFARTTRATVSKAMAKSKALWPQRAIIPSI